jgi:hypothetical protein
MSKQIISEEFKRMQKLAGLITEDIFISYTAIVLTRESYNQLLPLVPKGWDSSKTCHHCTLNMGKAEENIIPWLEKKVSLKVLGFVSDDKVCAVKVELPNGLSAFNVPSGIPHVTIAVTNGGKPFLAGKLDYSKMSIPPNMPTILEGVVKEVPKDDYSLIEN